MIKNMAIREEQKELVNKIVESNPELKDGINSVLEVCDDIYIAGRGFFGEINKEDKLVKIITEDAKIEGTDKNLFHILFDGDIYDVEESSEYNSLLTFRSNASGYLSVFFAPGINAFYVAPRIVKKAYKPTGDDKFAETELPGFTEGDMEGFQWWNDKYKILSENSPSTKDKPSK